MCEHCSNNHSDDSEILREFTYKDFIQQFYPGNLPHKDWSYLIKFVKYQGYRRIVDGDNSTYIIKFFVRSGRNGWPTFIEFQEMDHIIRDTSFNSNKAALLLLKAGDIKVHCQCPAYLYYGSKYILTQLSAAIEEEHRFPKIRNKHLKGITCKHLRKTLLVLGNNIGYIASIIKKERIRLGLVEDKPKRGEQPE